MARKNTNIRLSSTDFLAHVADTCRSDHALPEGD
jgi:hypothetical protein